MDRTKFSDLPEQGEFNLISEMVFNKVKEIVGHDALAKKITSDIQIGLVKDEIEESELEAWIGKKVKTHTESYISELWEYCFLYAVKLTEDPDLAQDTTQTVMVSFLQSHHEVVHIKGWLKQAVYNQCMNSIKDGQKQQDLGKKLKEEAPPAYETQDLDEEQLSKKLADNELKRLLTKAEYTEYKSITSFKTINDYAKAKSLNASAVRKRKHTILTNLKANYLNEQGWVNVPDILDYRTLVNIKRFLSTLIEKNRLGDYKQLYHYCSPEIAPKLQEILKGFGELSDWGISQTNPKCYQVSMIDMSIPTEPIFAIVDITINRANYIRITDCYGSILVGTIPESKLDHIPSEKGMCLLTEDDIYRYTH